MESKAFARSKYTISIRLFSSSACDMSFVISSSCVVTDLFLTKPCCEGGRISFLSRNSFICLAIICSKTFSRVQVNPIGL
ncbi:unnamed protein product [Meloidogyne enterolobii]|uniref:Uncharacterized protein n=1 Tax=Meloidogyne enterolobii TaxID=390850 RepID=A0ACB0XSF7_MELEN